MRRISLACLSLPLFLVLFSVALADPPPAQAPAQPAPTTAPQPAPTTTPPPPTPVDAGPKVDPNAVAATVNGREIKEIAVQRGLQNIPPDKQAQYRPELVNFLADNVIIDQHLEKLVTVDVKDVDAKLKQFNDEVQKQGLKPDEFMKRFLLTEAELKAEITAHLRWEKFVDSQATDKVLHDLFDANRDLFDGSTVRARHILLTPNAADAAAAGQAKQKLAGFKKQIEGAVAQGLAKEPATADNLARERSRAKITEDTFAAIAAKESMCPSKQQGGDLGYFPRAGSMVEPFAKAAFALKQYQLSEPVATQFGYHLILVTERRPGRDVKFEQVKDDVKEVFGERLRDTMITQLRPTAQVKINPPLKR
jgi:parvulin-like peptidyl-prolyl isomerase